MDDAGPLRGAVIGAGYFSHFHFDAWNRIDDAEIVAVCDLNIDKARQVGSQYRVDDVMETAQQIMDRDDLQFVDIIAGHQSHLELVRMAAEKGLAIICQTPLALTTQDAFQLVDIATRSGAPLMIHGNARFQPWYREIKKLWEQGVIGKSLHTLTFRSRMGDGHGSDAYLTRQPHYQTMDRFLIFESGIHAADTLRYLAGEVDRVFCHHRKLNPVIAGEDTALAMFGFRDGGMGVYDASRFNESTAEDIRYTSGQMTMEASGGTLRLDFDGSIYIHPFGKAERKHPYVPPTNGFSGDCVHATQKHFIDSLKNRVEFETSGREYLKSIMVTEAMYESAEKGSWIDVDIR